MTKAFRRHLLLWLKRSKRALDDNQVLFFYIKNSRVVEMVAREVEKMADKMEKVPPRRNPSLPKSKI